MFKKTALFMVDIETIDLKQGHSETGQIESITPKVCFNIGWTIALLDGTIIEKSNLIVKSVYHVEPHFIFKYYYMKNFGIRDYEMAIKAEDTAEALEIFFARMAYYEKLYNVEYWSYNAGFDIGGIQLMINRKGLQNKYKLPIKWYDVLELFAETVGKTDVYKAWCIKNEYNCIMNCEELYQYITPKGNFRTKAEIAWRYITKDLKFREAHIGMQDTEIELGILQYCRTISKKIKPIPQCCLNVVRIVNPHLLRGEIIHECSIFTEQNLYDLYWEEIKEIIATRK